jgi:hypothetical protein
MTRKNSSGFVGLKYLSLVIGSGDNDSNYIGSYIVDDASQILIDLIYSRNVFEYREWATAQMVFFLLHSRVGHGFETAHPVK